VALEGDRLDVGRADVLRVDGAQQHGELVELDLAGAVGVDAVDEPGRES
tara:strand:- start:940 stop:1086 length:147 start_codon:yes stop_codon:yes gene_type:complete